MSTERLNTKQQEAVDYRSGPLLVLAGPGTGKTRVIVHRVERIIRDGADPASIVAITFTNKAARELRERLSRLVGSGAADRMYAGTIHGFGDLLIRRYGDLIGLPARHVLLDSARRMRLLRDLVREHDLYADLVASGRNAILIDAARTIEHLQNWCIFPAEAERAAASWAAGARAAGDGADGGLFAPRAEGDGCAAERARAARFAEHARLYRLFDEACRARGWYGYGDMVLLAVRLLRESADAAALARDRHRHVIVDEFQDVDRGQIELVGLLCPARAEPDLCVVGDDDQSIYGFRGADDRAFAHFARLWPGAHTVNLEWNYRSEAPIVAVANAIMARADLRFAPEKVVDLPPEKRGASGAPPVEVVEYPDLGDEADTIASLILEERRRGPERPWASFAVIARSYADLERIAGGLAVEGIPARVARGPSLLDDRGVQDLLHWMNVLCDPRAVYSAQWLLTRPPFDVETRLGAEWGGEYRAACSRHAAGEDGRAAPPGFVPWLAERAGHDPRVRRFAGAYGALQEIAHRGSAHDALLSVIRIGQIAHAELPPGRERATRIGRLAEVLRFVREREPLLTPVCDLAAFRAYYNDLSGDERVFRTDDDERFGESDAEAERPDEVTLITAHKAKGLEFDTVFVARAFPRDGFPKLRADDEPATPAGLIDRAGDTRDPQARAHAEERRLFYVACTRARRRLVVLTKRQKSRSESLHFVHELVRDGALPAALIVRSSGSVLDGARAAGIALRGQSRLEEGGPTVQDRMSIAAIDRTVARRNAAEALDAVDRPGVTREDLDAAAARLRAAAARLAAAAEVGELDRVPAWAAAEGAAEAAEALLTRVRAGERRPGVTFPPLAPPLRLSYSVVTDYERCPRCYYLKHVLRIKETPDAGLVLGSVAHQALQQYYEQWRRADAEGRPAPGREQLLEIGRREFFRALPPGAEAPPDTLAQLLAQLTLTHQRLHDPADQIDEIEFSIRFPYRHGDGEHQFEAKLDRLDRLPGQGGHRIIDYKTGRATATKLQPRPDDLQLGIYALALRHHQGIGLDDRTTPARGVAEYWVLSTGERGRIDLASVDYDAVRAQIGQTVEGLLAGRFGRGAECRGLCDILGPG